jgi:hypothetical protein
MSSESLLQRLEAQLALPYPQKARLLREVAADLEATVRRLRAAGLDEATAEAAALRDFSFSPDDLAALDQVHASLATRILALCPPFVRSFVERYGGVVPLALAGCSIAKEVPVLGFLQEGGIGMYAILGIGLAMLARELAAALRLLVIKEHSRESLRLDTPSVLIGCLALMLFALGNAVLGLYVSADAVTAQKLPYALLVAGAKESLTPLVLGTMLSALVVLAHYATRRVLHAWQAPIVSV